MSGFTGMYASAFDPTNLEDPRHPFRALSMGMRPQMPQMDGMQGAPNPMAMPAPDHAMSLGAVPPPSGQTASSGMGAGAGTAIGTGLAQLLASLGSGGDETIRNKKLDSMYEKKLDAAPVSAPQQGGLY